MQGAVLLAAQPLRVKLLWSNNSSTGNPSATAGAGNPSLMAAAGPKWAQKTVTLPPHRRGCHLITPKVINWLSSPTLSRILYWSPGGLNGACPLHNSVSLFRTIDEKLFIYTLVCNFFLILLLLSLISISDNEGNWEGLVRIQMWPCSHLL